MNTKGKAVSAGWNEIRLGDVCQIELGRTPARNNPRFWDTKKATDNVWLTIADLLQTLNARVSESKEYIADEAAAKGKIVPKGTLLVSFKLTLGRLAFAGRDLYTNEAIAALTIRDEKVISKKYLYWYLTYFDWNKAAEGEEKIKGKTLNKKKLVSLPVILPPLSEQKQIVAVLDKAFAAIDTVIANTEQNIANVQELFESVIDHAVHAPETEWVETMLGNLCEFRRGLTYKKSDEVSVSRNAVLRANNITIATGKINYDEVRFIRNEIEIPESKKMVPGCLLVCTASGSKKHLGKIGLIEDDSGHAFGGFMGLLVPSESVSAKYLFYLTRSVCYRNFIDDLADGVNINNLKWAQLSRFPISLPPISDQKKITVFLDKLSTKNQSLISAYNSKMTALSEFKRAILRQAFAGELTAKA